MAAATHLTHDDSPLSLSSARKINVNSLAADIVLFGGEDLPGVMRAHGIDDTQLASLLESNAALRARITGLKKQIDADPKAIIRLKAASALEGNISTLNMMIGDPEAEVRDRTAAMRLLAELADALPKQDKAVANAGVVLQLNLGALTPGTTSGTGTSRPLPQPVNVIEHAS